MLNLNKCDWLRLEWMQNFITASTIQKGPRLRGLHPKLYRTFLRVNLKLGKELEPTSKRNLENPLADKEGESEEPYPAMTMKKSSRFQVSPR